MVAALAGIAARAGTATRAATKMNKASSNLKTGADFQIDVMDVADVIADASNTFAAAATGSMSAGSGVASAGRDIAQSLVAHDHAKKEEQKKEATLEYEHLKNTNVRTFLQEIELGL